MKEQPDPLGTAEFDKGWNEAMERAGEFCSEHLNEILAVFTKDKLRRKYYRDRFKAEFNQWSKKQ